MQNIGDLFYIILLLMAAGALGRIFYSSSGEDGPNETALGLEVVLEGSEMNAVKNERKRMGINPILIQLAVDALSALVGGLSGELFLLDCIGFRFSECVQKKFYPKEDNRLTSQTGYKS